MMELGIVLVVLRFIEFIRVVFFGSYPAGPLGMGY